MSHDSRHQQSHLLNGGFSFDLVTFPGMELDEIRPRADSTSLENGLVPSLETARSLIWSACHMKTMHRLGSWCNTFIRQQPNQAMGQQWAQNLAILPQLGQKTAQSMIWQEIG